MKMVTIQSTDVSSYVRLLLDKTMDHNAEQDEATDFLPSAEEGLEIGTAGASEKNSLKEAIMEKGIK